MKNIIDHLWQTQIQQVQILPTAIKLKDQNPKLYFYSHNKSRILRKKEHTIDQTIEALNLKDNQKFLCFIIKKNELRLKLIFHYQVVQSLQTNDENIVISPLAQKTSEIESYWEIFYDAKDSKVLCWQILTQNAQNVWCYNKVSIKDQIVQDKISKYCKQLCNKMQSRFKLTSCIKQLGLVIKINRQLTKIMLIWAYQLIFTKSQFYQFDYETKSIDNQGITVLPNLNADKYSQQQKRENIIETESSKCYEIKAKNQINCQQIECKGCFQMTQHSSAKQADWQAIIRLRKNKKLSIRGIIEGDYKICTNCYYDLDIQ